MGKERGSKAFFEVYRKQRKEESASGGPEQKPHPATPGALEDNAEPAAQESQAGSRELGPGTQDIGLKGQDSYTYQKPEGHEVAPQTLGLKRDDVHVRHDTLIYAALGAVFLALGCFFIGNKLGYDKGYKAERINAKSATVGLSVGSKKEQALQLTTKKTEGMQEAVPITASQTTAQGLQPQSGVAVAKEGKWVLRIISYKVGDRNTKKAAELARAIQREIGYDAFVAKTPKELVVCVGKFDSRDSSELLALQKEIRNFEYENKKQFKSCYPVRLK